MFCRCQKAGSVLLRRRTAVLSTAGRRMAQRQHQDYSQQHFDVTAAPRSQAYRPVSVWGSAGECPHELRLERSKKARIGEPCWHP
eukprot:994108-Rhodomonas_salina.1